MTTEGNIARIRTPPYILPGNQCIEFFYHMSGVTSGTLSVYIVPVGKNVTSPLWTLSGHHGNEWRRASFITSSSLHFQVNIDSLNP